MNQEDLKKEIEQLKIIIQEHQKIIELLKNRLIELTNDVDIEKHHKTSYYNLSFGPYMRTEEWKW